jgi:hypothetical protein
MNFIEQIFGLSPDADSGSLELVLFLAPLVVALAFIQWRKRRSRN